MAKKNKELFSVNKVVNIGDERLNTYVELWKHLDDLLNSFEHKYANVLVIMLTLLTPYIAYQSNIKGEIKLALALFVPLLALIIFAYVSYLFRFVAILRGYLSGLENDIDELLGKRVFRWNGDYINAYVSNCRPNKYLMLSFGVAILIIAIFFTTQIISLWKDSLVLTWFSGCSLLLFKSFCVLYSIFIFVIATLIGLTFVVNESVRRDARKLYEENKEEILTPINFTIFGKRKE